MELQNESNLYLQMLSNKSDKIFLEAVDQFFENSDSGRNFEAEEKTEDELKYGEIFKKLNVNFCCDLDEKDISTEVESDDSRSDKGANSEKKLIKFDEILVENYAEKVRKFREKMKEKYVALIFEEKKGGRGEEFKKELKTNEINNKGSISNVLDFVIIDERNKRKGNYIKKTNKNKMGKKNNNNNNNSNSN